MFVKAPEAEDSKRSITSSSSDIVALERLR